ncbi:hypothetical protein KGF56_003861 [Candida oxycetoniae]|uniref:NADH dehydrogenase [ubiquinone] 1 alpha subcomplex subunit n=1 Tax=Candida oxycetoniae TaxID=497107 RepID=A0AAI9SUI3_9ASCO|nr:uncharacterized protein KGF56_003861 [Candida oxycetoniae]KAI3403273.2 hypothetical protein KGF56_003861 [Candida oxycetoniae]
MDPYRKELFEVDYFKTVPPQWLQWLRRTREEAPSLNELVQDQFRQQRLRILAKQADEKWKNEKWRLQQEANAKLQNELNRIESENKVREEEKGKEEEKKEEKGAILDSNPWKQADKLKDTNPIESATIKPR